MQKIIMILLLAGFSANTLFAQDSDETAKRALEREIKVSGNYLYGEAVGKTKDEALKMANAALTSEIKKELQKHPEWQFAKSIQAKDVESNADMIDLMREKRFRVITYIKKDNIQAVFGNPTPVVKMDDRKQQPETGTQATGSQPQPKAGETKVSVSEPAKPAPAVQQDGLLGQILHAPSMREIQKIFKENKLKGKCAYGEIDKLTAPEKAYLIVHKSTGEIVAILDKGSVDHRKDLLSGEVKSNAILEQNQVTWFQLF